ncbi:hypothetical protein BJY16_004688 [Actinoplanes octamycinicus]|uniref:Uncharacterized protein n=1 Tax=Actinoplanes octamycinicus TaxID=135948 RepID=A0A7W7M8T0_9ACTN|nr:hypothetical protein [Actinoplanes octamycinicus]MBB4741229.1 hypothetical protein [Actinoplanes octamycinicus]GIE56136.1 hypothetical protein Aoc01nite_15380 [Actinoplanes octamycinicus]
MPERGHLFRTLTGLGVALAAGAALLFGAPAQSGEPQPLPLAATWPQAQRGSVPSKLPDGSEYSPALFLDAKTSAGTVQSPDGHTLRLILRQADGTIRELRKVPAKDRAPFAALTSVNPTPAAIPAPSTSAVATSGTSTSAAISGTSTSADASTGASRHSAPGSSSGSATDSGPDQARDSSIGSTTSPSPEPAPSSKTGFATSASPEPARSSNTGSATSPSLDPAPSSSTGAATSPSGGSVPGVGAAPTTGAAASSGAGDSLVWVESVDGKQQLWTGGLRQPARMVTADVGAMQFYDSQYDLVIADGAVHWVASGFGDQTEFRSVPLAGGKVNVTRSPGTWALSAWPWAVDGQTSARGATTLRNLATGQRIAVPSADRTVTACSPAWCQMVSLNADGYSRMELSHPDGSARRKVAEGTVATAITDVAVLDRFEVLARVGPQSELSGNQELLIHDLKTRQTILVSPDAGNITYRAGVLWWSTGDQSSFIRNSLDLRTI